jgi:hypothetical protein
MTHALLSFYTTAVLYPEEWGDDRPGKRHSGQIIDTYSK